MDTMRKILAILLVLTLLAGTTAALAATDETFATPGERYAETVTVSTVRILSPNLVFKDGDDINNNLWTRYYLDEENIKVEYRWTQPTSEAYEQRVDLSLTTGDLPDFMRLTATQYEDALAAGLLADLTEVYETYASPALKERMTLTGDGPINAGTSDGKLYALVQETDNHTNYPGILFIRKDWREAVDMEAPTTVDELIELARAFSEQDPDGNGADDTYGLMVDQYVGLRYLMNCMGAYQGCWLDMGDGTYEYSSIQPEMRSALETLHTMYADGLLKTDFLTSTSNWADVNSGKAGMFINSYTSPLSLMDGYEQSGIEWEMYPMPALTEESYPAASQLPNGYDSYWVVNKDCEHPEAMIKLMNVFVDLQTNRSDYLHDTDGTPLYEYNAVSMNTPDNNYINYLSIVEALESGDTSALAVQAVQAYDYCQAYLSGSGNRNDWAYYMIFGPESSCTVLGEYYIDPDNYVQSAWGGAPTPGMISYSASLNSLEEETFIQIIVGGDLTAFDSFVNSWYLLGGETITQEVNAGLSA